MKNRKENRRKKNIKKHRAGPQPSYPEPFSHLLRRAGIIRGAYSFYSPAELMLAAKLSFDQRKFILKCYWKYKNAVEVQRHFTR